MDSVGILIQPDDNPDDPIWQLPAIPVDAEVARAPLSKARREDLQVLSFMLAVSLHGGQHPLGVRPGADPPDRELTGPDSSWGLELTELTTQDVREEIAQARSIGRRLEAMLLSRTGLDHLTGRGVALSYIPQLGNPLPGDLDRLVEQLADALEEDKGCVGDGIDVSQGLPEQWPNDAGFYGSYGPVNMQVRRGTDVDDHVRVGASAQAAIRRSEALAALAKRIEAKDLAGNDILLITCGLPDAQGYTCPLDAFIFRFIADALVADPSRLPTTPDHLKAVALHHWGNREILEIYRADSMIVPWHSGP
jgi:hypothetical protein